MDSRVNKLHRKLDKSLQLIERLKFEVEILRSEVRLLKKQSACFSLDDARRHVQEMIEARTVIPNFPKTRKAGNEVRALSKSGRDFPVRLSADRVPVPFLPPYRLMDKSAKRISERKKCESKPSQEAKES